MRHHAGRRPARSRLDGNAEVSPARAARHLLERILAQTSGQAAAQAKPPPIVLGTTDRLRTPNTSSAVPPLFRPRRPAAAFASANVLPFRTRISHGFRSIGHTMLQPRLAMTAAMAFFSIALTLNLTGVRLSDLRASDFKPSSIMRSASEAKARVVRYSDNLRVVYELESRVRDLQRSHSNDRQVIQHLDPRPPRTTRYQQPAGNQQPDDPNASQAPRSRTRNSTKPNPGSSRRETPTGSHPAGRVGSAPARLPLRLTKLLLSLLPVS